MSKECQDKELQEMMAESDQIHTLWHKLNAYVEKHGRDMNTLSGWDDIRMMDAFCKEHHDIIRVHVDDAYHCNSYLYVVPHEGEKRYMGATVVVVPQCCNIRNQFFLYPADNRGLMKACRELEDRFLAKGDPVWKEMYGDLNEDGEDTKD